MVNRADDNFYRDLAQ